MAQLPELSDLNILPPSGLLAEAIKLCSNTQMLKTLNATSTETQLFVTYFIIIVQFGLIEFAKIKRHVIIKLNLLQSTQCTILILYILMANIN